MRTIPTDDDVKALNAEPWMMALLHLNPSYLHWGPHEDYMCKKGDGWDCPRILPTWADFSWELNELNECVHFYFSVERASQQCAACDGQGVNPETKAISDGFYGQCSDCGGQGYIYTEPSAHVSLTLWILHPRKGCSRGVEITRISQADLPAIVTWLTTAAERNAERFARVVSRGMAVAQ